MKIVIQSINFYPDLTGVGKYTGEMASWLASKGHDVRVITAPPYYPQWKISKPYKKYSWSSELYKGVKVWRCPIWVPTRPCGFTRLLHLMSFALSSFPVILGHILWRPNIIMSIEPPLFTAPAAIILAKVCRAKSILHIQDYEIDAAFNLGLLRGKVLKKTILGIERFLLRRFNLVSTISSKMIDKALSKGLNPQNIFLLPNWVNINSEAQYAKPQNKLLNKSNLQYRARLKIPSNGLIALYSGSMGEKQGLEILGQVARLYQIDKINSLPLIHFIFCGSGVGREKLQNECRDLRYVYFLDFQPEKHLDQFLAMADIHLLPQRSDVSDLVMPSKLTGIMASGKPVIVSANADTELANITQGSGIVVPPDDPNSFFEALVTLASNKILRHTLGQNGFKYAKKHFSQERIMLDFESKLYYLLKDK
tara:strand:+ start:4535 stop:5803 length:1269 start_codon:yes stop_codon:yes gene_type:complete